MNKKRILLTIFIVLGILIRTQFLGSELHLDPTDPYHKTPDTYFHRSIVEQSLEKGHIDNTNDLDFCYTDKTGSHPKGYYFLHYVMGSFFGNFGIIITPIIYWLFTILFAYLLTKIIFNEQTAILLVGLVSVTYANIERSSIISFRGENIIMPFMMASLYYLLLAFEKKDYKKKILYGSLAGIISGLTIGIWNGSAAIILTLGFTLGLYLIYNYLEGRFNFEMLEASFALLLSQAIVIFILSKILLLQDKGSDFATKDYYLVILLPLTLLFGILGYCKKRKWNPKATILTLFTITIIGIVTQISRIKEFFETFKITGTNILISTVSETQKVDLSDLWTRYWFLPILVITGLFVLTKKNRRNTIYFLGFLIPSLVLLYLERRYLFFSSIPILILVAISLDHYMQKRRCNKILFWTFIVAIIITIYQLSIEGILFSIIPLIFLVLYFYIKQKGDNKILPPIGIALLLTVILFFSLVLDRDLYNERFENTNIKALEFFKQNTHDESCLITNWDIGGLAQQISGQYTYTSSVGAQNLKRIEKYTDFLFSNQTPDYDLHDAYIMSNADYLYLLNSPTFTLNKINIINPIYALENLPPEVYLVQQKNGNVNLNQRTLVEGKFDIGEVSKVFYNAKVHYNTGGQGCLYVEDEKNMIYIRDELCNTNLVKMLMKENLAGMEIFYYNTDARIYKINNTPFCKRINGKWLNCDEVRIDGVVSETNSIGISYEVPIYESRNSSIAFGYYPQKDIQAQPEMVCSKQRIQGAKRTITKGNEITFILDIPNGTLIDNQKCRIQILEENEIIDDKEISIIIIEKKPITKATTTNPLVLPEEIKTSYKGGTYLYMNYYSNENATITPLLNCGGSNIAYGPRNQVGRKQSNEIRLYIHPYAFNKNELDCSLFIRNIDKQISTKIKISNYGYNKTTSTFYSR